MNKEEKTSNIERSELFNKISDILIEVVEASKLKGNGDAIDIPSGAVKIEQLLQSSISDEEIDEYFSIKQGENRLTNDALENRRIGAKWLLHLKEP